MVAPRDAAVPPAVYSLDGLLVFGLLLVCTCAYLRKVPRLRAWLLSEKRGLWGVGYKGEGGLWGGLWYGMGAEVLGSDVKDVGPGWERGAGLWVT